MKMHYAHIYSTKPFQYQSVLLQSLKLVFELNIKFSKDIHLYINKTKYRLYLFIQLHHGSSEGIHLGWVAPHWVPP